MSFEEGCCRPLPAADVAPRVEVVDRFSRVPRQRDGGNMFATTTTSH